jgi:hypothetical protein
MRTLKIDTVITEPKLARYCGVSISGITHLTKVAGID